MSSHRGNVDGLLVFIECLDVRRQNLEGNEIWAKLQTGHRDMLHDLREIRRDVRDSGVGAMGVDEGLNYHELRLNCGREELRIQNLEPDSRILFAVHWNDEEGEIMARKVEREDAMQMIQGVRDRQKQAISRDLVLSEPLHLPELCAERFNDTVAVSCR